MATIKEMVTRRKIEHLLAMVKQGKTEELLNDLDASDIQKLQNTMKQLGSMNASDLGLNIEKIKQQIPEAEMKKLEDRLQALPPDLAGQLQKFLNET